VHGVLVVNRRVIDGAILPDDIVGPAERRALVVIDPTGDVLARGVIRGRHRLEQLALRVGTIEEGECADDEDDEGAAQEEGIATLRPLDCRALGGFPFLPFGPFFSHDSSRAV
jgi:hypothetical protein